MERRSLLAGALAFGIADLAPAATARDGPRKIGILSPTPAAGIFSESVPRLSVGRRIARDSTRPAPPPRRSPSSRAWGTLSYDLTINRGTARKLGLEIPPDVVLRATRIVD